LVENAEESISSNPRDAEGTVEAKAVDALEEGAVETKAVDALEEGAVEAKAVDALEEGTVGATDKLSSDSESCAANNSMHARQVQVGPTVCCCVPQRTSFGDTL
jgi:hypothetical protein